MSTLCFSYKGEPFAPPTTATSWRVRCLREGQRGQLDVMRDSAGQPLVLPIAATYEQLREAVGQAPGRYRLDMLDDQSQAIDGEAAYVTVVAPASAGARNAAPPWEQGGTDDNDVPGTVAAHAVRSTPVMVTAPMDLAGAAAAGGDDLSRVPPVGSGPRSDDDDPHADDGALGAQRRHDLGSRPHDRRRRRIGARCRRCGDAVASSAAHAARTARAPGAARAARRAGDLRDAPQRDARLRRRGHGARRRRAAADAPSDADMFAKVLAIADKVQGVIAPVADVARMVMGGFGNPAALRNAGDADEPAPAPGADCAGRGVDPEPPLHLAPDAHRARTGRRWVAVPPPGDAHGARRAKGTDGAAVRTAVR